MIVADGDIFTADFFNNVAAVAMVLMATKVVAHRTGKVTKGRRWRSVLHGCAVAAAVIAIGASLWATEWQKETTVLHVIAWMGLGGATVALLIDLFIEDVWPHWTAHETVSRTGPRRRTPTDQQHG